MVLQGQWESFSVNGKLLHGHKNVHFNKCSGKQIRKMLGTVAELYQTTKFLNVFHEALDMLHIQQKKTTASNVWSEQELYLSRYQLVAKNYCVYMTEVKIARKVLFLKLLSL